MSDTQVNDEISLTPGTVVIVTLEPRYAASQHIPVYRVGSVEVAHVRGIIRRLRRFSLDLTDTSTVDIPSGKISPIGGVTRTECIPWQAIACITPDGASGEPPDGREA